MCVSEYALPTDSMCIVFVFYVLKKHTTIVGAPLFYVDFFPTTTTVTLRVVFCSGFTDHVVLQVMFSFLSCSVLHGLDSDTYYNHSLYYANEFVFRVKFKQSKGFSEHTIGPRERKEGKKAIHDPQRQSTLE